MRVISNIESDYQNCHIGVWNLVIEKKFQKLHIYPLSTPWDQIELIVTVWSPVFEIQADFQNCISGHKTWLLKQKCRIFIWTLFPLTGVGWNWTLRTLISEMQAYFQNLPWNLEFGKSLHIDPLSTPTELIFSSVGRNFSYWSAFYPHRVDIQLCGQKFAYWSAFYPHRVDIQLCGQWFLRYGLIYKIAIFGMKPRIWKKLPEVTYMDCVPTRGCGNWAYFLSAGFPRYGLIFKIAIFGHEIFLSIYFVPATWKRP